MLEICVKKILVKFGKLNKLKVEVVDCDRSCCNGSNGVYGGLHNHCLDAGLLLTKSNTLDKTQLYSIKSSGEGSTDNCFYNRTKHGLFTSINSIRYGTYQSKSIPSHIQHTPDGLVLLKITKHANWPESLGLLFLNCFFFLSFLLNWNTNKGLKLCSAINGAQKGFAIMEFEQNGIAERLNIFEASVFLFFFSNIVSDGSI